MSSKQMFTLYSLADSRAIGNGASLDNLKVAIDTDTC